MFLSKLDAQITFCPPGAKWNYRFEGQGNGDAFTSYNYPIWYSGDTIVAGDTLKILSYISFSRFNGLQPPPYIAFIKQRGDTIFMRSYKTNHQWQILYNFAAQVGQSWTNTIATYTCKTTVNLVDTVILNTKPVRRLWVTYTDGSPGVGPYQGYITEHIGSSDYLFNFRYRYASDMAEYREFLCYSDSTIGTIQFSTKPCNYSDLVGIEEQLKGTDLRVFPNPVNDFLNIESTEDLQITLTDLNGKILKQEEWIDQKINTSDLVPGMYFLQIRKGGELVYRNKVIKE